jgi:crotonobetainyl-CoA:carnitine CoA-transferase CaiB-like acyl-CoA transferase
MGTAFQVMNPNKRSITLDLGSGMWATIGCLAALRPREATGAGCVVDTSLFETSLTLVAPAMATLSVSGKAPARQRAASSASSTSRSK